MERIFPETYRRSNQTNDSLPKSFSDRGEHFTVHLHQNHNALTYRVKLQLHGTIYRPDSFVLMLCYCVNLKAIRYESMSLNRIVADKSHRVIVALHNKNILVSSHCSLNTSLISQ